MPPQQIKGEIALWRNIVKKIFSLIIALTLLVSIFAVSAVAFAEEERITLTVDFVYFIENNGYFLFVCAKLSQDSHRGFPLVIKV